MKKLILKLKTFNRYYLMPIVVLIFFLSFYIIYSDIKNKTIKEFNNEQLILAKTASQGITSFFDNNKSNLVFLAQYNNIIDFSDEGKHLLAQFYETHKTKITAITRVNAKGVILYTYPYNQTAINQDISHQKHIKQIIATHQPVLSDVFMSAQGYLAIAMHVPVFKNKEFVGSLAILIPLDELGKEFLGNIGIKKSGHAWLHSENGFEIYCPIKGHTGKSFLETAHPCKNTIEMLHKIKTESSGTAQCFHKDNANDCNNNTDEMYCVFYRTPIGNTYWTIVISYNIEEVNIALNQLRIRLSIIFSLLFLAISFYFYSLAKVQNVLKEEKKRKDAEKKLQESEAFLENIFENIPNMIFIKDAKDLKFVRLNKAGENLLGYSKDEIIGKSDYDLFPKEQADFFTSKDKAVLNRANLLIIEEENINTKKGERILYTKKIIIKDIYGKGKYILGISEDITELTLTKNDLLIAKEKAEENEIKLKEAQKVAKLGSWELNISNNTLNWSDEIYRIFGCEPNEIEVTYDSFLSFIHSEDRALVNEAYQLHLNTKKTYNIIHRILLKDNQIKYVNERCKTEYNQDGKPVRSIGTIADITDRIQIESELIKAKEKSEENERIIINVSNNLTQGMFYQVIIFPDDTKKFIYLSNSVNKFYGCTSDEAKENANLIYSKVHPDDIESLLIKEKEALTNMSDFESICRIFNPDGTIRWSSLKSTPRLFNNLVYWDGIEVDITNLKTAEQEIIHAKEKAEESDRLKTSFLQNMSHEIRTPMNAIMGFSSLLAENYNDKPKLEHFAGIISQRCNDLLEIINDILDIAKIESGQLPVNDEVCNINNLFAELTAFFVEYQKRIDKKHITFSLQNNSNSLNATIITDKVKLRQIFINILSNAFKFTEMGKIEGGCKLDENNNIVFYVSDTGIGIPADKQELVFERFAQLEPGKNKLVSGTGLGLSIAKGLVNLLGGEIWLESEPDKGTTFYFSLPFKIAQSSIHEQIFTDKKQEYIFYDKTILIVEDDLFNAEFIKIILSNTGLNIIHTPYGHEAVQIATTQSPDLVLMDIRLPDINGYEAIHQILQHNPHAKIIAQTAYAAHDDKQKAFDAGCLDYISKPLQKNMLLAIINKHI